MSYPPGHPLYGWRGHGQSGFGGGMGQSPDAAALVAQAQAANGGGGGGPAVLISGGELAQILRDTAGQNQALLRAVTEAITELRQIQKKREAGAIPRFIEDIPGKRVPYTWVVTVLFDEAISNASRKSGTATLSEDGPFVITDYRCYWQVTTQSSSGADADVFRAFLPPSRLPMLIRAATAAPVIDRDIIDFLVALKLSGGDRLWQNTDVPAVSFYDAQTPPRFAGIPGLIERNETMTVEATAQVSGTAANAPDSAARGTFWFIMNGYKILRPIDYAEAQGWTL